MSQLFAPISGPSTHPASQASPEEEQEHDALDSYIDGPSMLMQIRELMAVDDSQCSESASMPRMEFYDQEDNNRMPELTNSTSPERPAKAMLLDEKGPRGFVRRMQDVARLHLDMAEVMQDAEESDDLLEYVRRNQRHMERRTEMARAGVPLRGHTLLRQMMLHREGMCVCVCVFLCAPDIYIHMFVSVCTSQERGRGVI
jgi:hypothetical protein